MEAKKVKVSVIIPSWNTRQLLRQCLKSLDSKIEIIVVDNGSTDGSPQMVEKEFSEVILIKNKKNLGFGAANNQGTRKAKGDYLLLLNSDTIVRDSAPLMMAEFMERHPEVGALGCKLFNPDGTVQFSAGRFPNLLVALVMLFLEHWFKGGFVLQSYDEVRAVDWVMGAALMFPRSIIAKVGLMDEGIFMYMDEVEWCYRIKKAGWQVMFYPDPQIIHFGGGSSSSGRKEPILSIYRGLIYFYKKHYPGYQLPILRMMLKLKAAGALIVGGLTNNRYLKQTYAEALKNI